MLEKKPLADMRHLFLKIAYSLRKFSDDFSADDLVAEAWPHLEKAYARWDPKRNVKIESYLGNRARWLFIAALQKETVQRERFRLLEEFPDLVAKADPCDFDLLDWVESRLSILAEKNREVMHLVYREGLTVGEVAERFGVSNQAIRQRIELSLEKIREAERMDGVKLNISFSSERAEKIRELCSVLRSNRGATVYPVNAIMEAIHCYLNLLIKGKKSPEQPEGKATDNGLSQFRQENTGQKPCDIQLSQNGVILVGW